MKQLLLTHHAHSHTHTNTHTYTKTVEDLSYPYLIRTAFMLDTR